MTTVIAAVTFSAVLTGWPLTFYILFCYLTDAPVAILSGLSHRSITYEIAEPYKGWVIITYGKPECKPLDRTGFSLVVHVDKSGTGCSSDNDPLDTWRRWEYVYVAPNGSKKPISSDMILGPAIHPVDAAHRYEVEHFFVGTGDALKNAWSSEPK